MTNINNKIIIAPLNWGLGHATRCIPVIKQLIHKGYEPIIAGTNETLELIHLEFKQLPTLLLPSYNISYHTFLGSSRLYLLKQFFKLKKVIKEEHEIISQFCKKEHIKYVISDNRYGAYCDTATNIFITHQLQIATGLGNWADVLLQKWHYKFLKPFQQIWVPDYESALINLSGKLSHTKKIPASSLKFIGPLSRLQATTTTTQKGFNFTFIISGPEPHKTTFIQAAILLAATYKQPINIIGGNVLNTSLPTNLPSHINYLPHASTTEMQQIIENSKYIICRSGYSSIMDTAALQAKCIMLPTPSQTEQIYLAQYLGNKKYILALHKMPNDLHALLAKAEAFEFKAWPKTEALNLPI